MGTESGHATAETEDPFLTDQEHFQVYAVLRNHHRLRKRSQRDDFDQFVGVTSAELNAILRHMHPRKRQLAPNRMPPLTDFQVLGMAYQQRISFFGYLFDPTRSDTGFRITGLFIQVRNRRAVAADIITERVFRHMNASIEEHRPDEEDLWEYGPEKTGFRRRQPCYRAWWD